MNATNSNMRAKNPARVAVVLSLVLSGLALDLAAQNFDAGSTGALGDVVITSNTTINLPDDGKLHFRSLKVNSGNTLTFGKNPRNTPVFILAQTEVIVEGTINIDGSARTRNTGGAGG